ncbi:MAG: ribonuclease HII [Bifidobacteriaceae bacterium]|jgi:ribonuclease HII|nr:ribonuclease HII [Bifidobacteriaceae bacterium]
MDEVGRGALAGPVTVGVVCVDASTPQPPPGLNDSKRLTPAARERLVPLLEAWGAAWALGWSGADEVDRHGLVAALRLAGRRALEQLPQAPGVIVLDGHHDWLSAPAANLFDQPEADPWRVHLKVKADAACASVAAASVLAKVSRDAVMSQLHLEHPGYGWDHNKGYGAPDHLAALQALGPCERHRRSWALPEVQSQEDVRS